MNLRPLKPMLIALSILPFSAKATEPPAVQRTCTPAFKGDDFLQAASGRGLKPESTSATACYNVTTGNNIFQARPNASCGLRFSNSAWLAPNARFKSIVGQGAFSRSIQADGVHLTIDAGGGFYLRNVTVEITGLFKSCVGLKPEDVLSGG